MLEHGVCGFRIGFVLTASMFRCQVTFYGTGYLKVGQIERSPTVPMRVERRKASNEFRSAADSIIAESCLLAKVVCGLHMAQKQLVGGIVGLLVVGIAQILQEGIESRVIGRRHIDTD